MFLCEFCKIVKNIFWQDTSGWLLLVFICEFWEVVQITSEYLWETSYFKYKLLDFNHQIQDSAASRCILVPFERYGRPKNVFPYIFHVKPKWNIVYKYSKKKKFFSRDSNILSQMHWTKDIFGHPVTIIGGLGVMYGCSNAGKKYFTSAFQAFYTRARSSYSKARSSHQRCSIKKGVL